MIHINQRQHEAEDLPHLLKEALDFIYHKLSQINLELNNFQISQSRELIAHNIVAFEQKTFQERLAAKQFNLQFVSEWIDKFVSNPQDYRLELPILCSQQLGFYVSSALLVALVQQPVSTVLHTIPETFYLDRLKIVNWHAQYQNLIDTATALSYLETFARNYGLTFTTKELSQHKNRFVQTLAAETFTNPQEKAELLITLINQLLWEKKQALSLTEQNTLRALIEKCCLGSNQVHKNINKHMGEQLSFYLLKGHLPDPAYAVLRRYGLESELDALGKAMSPVLRLHTKVHGPFYQQQMEHGLWKPLFSALRQSVIADELPELFAPEREHIYTTHALLHKLAFVLSGLALIQQAVVHSDMWNLKLTLKNTALKELASSFGLIDLIKNPEASKELIERRLMELMHHVAEEYELPYGEKEQHDMARMLRLAKNEKSLGCHAFLDELLHQTRQFVVENKESMNQGNLLYEFKEETGLIRSAVTELIQRIKQAHHPYELVPEPILLPVLRSGRGMGQL